MKCHHKWDEVSRHFAPPVGVSLQSGGVEGQAAIEALERMAHGVTTVVIRCEKCGDIGARLLLGDCRRPEDRL